MKDYLNVFPKIGSLLYRKGDLYVVSFNKKVDPCDCCSMDIADGEYDDVCFSKCQATIIDCTTAPIPIFILVRKNIKRKRSRRHI